eukprot:9872850-Heterocapsa_arctica.AAC.1
MTTGLTTTRAQEAAKGVSGSPTGPKLEITVGTPALHLVRPTHHNKRTRGSGRTRIGAAPDGSSQAMTPLLNRRPGHRLTTRGTFQRRGNNNNKDSSELHGERTQLPTHSRRHQVSQLHRDGIKQERALQAPPPASRMNHDMMTLKDGKAAKYLGPTMRSGRRNHRRERSAQHSGEARPREY